MPDTTPAEQRTFKALFQPAQKRTEVVRNEVYSVYPVVALVEGVLHASNSPAPELALATEFGALPEAWNGRPVVLSHPVINGVAISANAPEVLDSSTMGFLFGTKLEDNKLKSEVWINRKWAAENGQQDVLNILDNGGALEVSTGLFAQVEQKPGMFNGQAYSGIWRNVIPDHLAILPPGAIGACSIEGGCGIPRINEQGGSLMTTPESSTQAPETENVQNGCNCQKTQQNAQEPREGDGQEKVLTKILNAFAKLLNNQPQEAPEPQASVSANAEQTSSAAPAQEAPAAQQEPQTLAEFIESAPEKFREELKDLMGSRNSAIDRFCQQILACENNAFSEDELKAMKFGQLEKLANLASKSKNPPEQTQESADFSGRGASRDSNQGADPGYTAPMLVFPRKTA